MGENSVVFDNKISRHNVASTRSPRRSGARFSKANCGNGKEFLYVKMCERMARRVSMLM